MNILEKFLNVVSMSKYLEEHKIRTSAESEAKKWRNRFIAEQRLSDAIANDKKNLIESNQKMIKALNDIEIKAKCSVSNLPVRFLK